MRVVALFSILWVACCDVRGQDMKLRIDQYQMAAEGLSAASCVYFDATLLESNEQKKTLVQTQSVGRRVVGPKGEVRVDVRITETDLKTGVTTNQSEHFIQFGPNEYLVGMRLFGAAITIFDVAKDVQAGSKPVTPHGFNNPFLVAMGGDNVFLHSTNGFANVVSVPDLDNTIRPSRDIRAGYVRTLTFSDSVPWAITSWKSVFSPDRFKVGRTGTPGEDLPTWESIKDSKQLIKNWNIIAAGAIDWLEVENLGMVPSRVVTQFHGFPKIDDRETDFQVHYFGYEFDSKKVEKLFDRDRFNDANIDEDFPLEWILGQAEAAKNANGKMRK